MDILVYWKILLSFKNELLIARLISSKDPLRIFRFSTVWFVNSFVRLQILTIEHSPVAKTRPRLSTFRGRAVIYDIQSSLMRKIKTLFKKQMRDKGYLKLEEGAILFKMTAHMPIPKTSAKKTREMEGQPHAKKKDIDNIFKFYSDILNGIAYKDDGQICAIMCKKFYSSQPRVEIVIEPYSEKKEKCQCW